MPTVRLPSTAVMLRVAEVRRKQQLEPPLGSSTKHCDVVCDLCYLVQHCKLVQCVVASNRPETAPSFFFWGEGGIGMKDQPELMVKDDLGQILKLLFSKAAPV